MKNIITNETPYRVSTLRESGLEAKWSKSETGRPMMVARDPNAKSSHQRNTWWIVDDPMWGTMKKHGIIDGFNSATLLGNVFYL
tara:strand:- start:5725 stop:5976 length:252 start_codon:yes stop_codon:yes gene_type:complete